MWLCMSLSMFACMLGIVVVYVVDHVVCVLFVFAYVVVHSLFFVFVFVLFSLCVL